VNCVGPTDHPPQSRGLPPQQQQPRVPKGAVIFGVAIRGRPPPSHLQPRQQQQQHRLQTVIQAAATCHLRGQATTPVPTLSSATVAALPPPHH